MKVDGDLNVKLKVTKYAATKDKVEVHSSKYKVPSTKFKGSSEMKDKITVYEKPT